MRWIGRVPILSSPVWSFSPNVKQIQIHHHSKNSKIRSQLFSRSNLKTRHRTVQDQEAQLEANSQLVIKLILVIINYLKKNNFLSFIISEGDSTTTSTTPSPTPSLSDTQQVDYDGSNVTVKNITQDHHRYYNRWDLVKSPQLSNSVEDFLFQLCLSSTYPDGMQFWIDFEKENSSTHDMLSASHRRAAVRELLI